MTSNLFGELAVERGYLARSQVDQALALQKERGGTPQLGQTLVELGFLTKPMATALLRLQGALDSIGVRGPDENKLLGEKLGGCLVVDRIGSGGMGTTYLAHQLRLDREVVLKVLHPRLVKLPGNVQRFEREARTAARLDHPAIVTVYDFDQQPPFHFIVMQYVEGVNLRDTLYERGPLGARRAAWIAERVLEGLSHAHAHGIVHRDIKPANLMITREPRVKITDFGLVRVISMTTSERLSAFGEILGTPQYMAPEQASSGDLDGRADLYSLGVTLFELVSGRAPFTGASTMEVLEKQILEPIPDLLALAPGTPPELWAFIKRLTEKDPTARFASADAALAELRRIKLGPPTSAFDPKGAPEEPKDPSRQAPAVRAVPQQALRELRDRLDESKAILLVDFEANDAIASLPPKRRTRRLSSNLGPPPAAFQEPGDPRAAIEAARKKGEADRVVPEILASLYARERDQEIIGLEKEIEQAAPLSAGGAYYLGLAKERQADFDGARAHLALAVSLAPNHVPARSHLARVLTELSQNDLAREVLVEGVALSPQSVPANVRLAEFLYIVAKDSNGAIAAYEKAIELAPSRFRLRQQLAWILYELGRLDDALAVVREVLQWRAGEEQARELEKRILEDKKRLEAPVAKAAEQPEPDVGDAPPSPSVKARLERIRLCAAGGRQEEAVRLATLALKVRPKSVPLLLAHGKALAALGRMQEAQEAYTKAAALAPDNEEAKKGPTPSGASRRPEAV